MGVVGSSLHLHLAVGLRAVLVLHMPETNGNKAFTADTTVACTPIWLLLCSRHTLEGGGYLHDTTGSGASSLRMLHAECVPKTLVKSRRLE